MDRALSDLHMMITPLPTGRTRMQGGHGLTPLLEEMG